MPQPSVFKDCYASRPGVLLTLIPLSSGLFAFRDTKGFHLLPKGHESWSLGSTFGQVQISPSTMTDNLATPVKEPGLQGGDHWHRVRVLDPVFRVSRYIGEEQADPAGTRVICHNRPITIIGQIQGRLPLGLMPDLLDKCNALPQPG
jgi:hypothetical protein